MACRVPWKADSELRAACKKFFGFLFVWEGFLRLLLEKGWEGEGRAGLGRGSWATVQSGKGRILPCGELWGWVPFRHVPSWDEGPAVHSLVSTSRWMWVPGKEVRPQLPWLSEGRGSIWRDSVQGCRASRVRLVSSRARHPEFKKLAQGHTTHQWKRWNLKLKQPGFRGWPFDHCTMLRCVEWGSMEISKQR